jgi:hypothetical protein
MRNGAPGGEEGDVLPEGEGEGEAEGELDIGRGRAGGGKLQTDVKARQEK